MPTARGRAWPEFFLVDIITAGKGIDRNKNRKVSIDVE